ncbi:DNA repair protein RecN [Desulfocurvus sp. DL9XJH121]
MLELLRIRNLALIEDLELELAPGLNVLTGETGAGKSFILRSLNFLLGDKLESSMVRDPTGKAVVEGLFVQDGEELVIRRELAGDTGRSRLFVNDSLSSQNAVQDLRQRLIWHTSQHGQQRLLSPAYQARILDRFLPDPALLERRESLLADLRAVAAERGELADKIRDLTARREYLEYQAKEIAKVDPQAGEEERLMEARKAHKDAARAQEAAADALEALHGQGEGLLDRSVALVRALEALASLDEDWAAEAEAWEEFRLRLGELDRRLRSAESDAGGGYDPEKVEARLYELAQLRRKLNRSLGEIVDFRAEIEENLSFLDSCALDEKRLARREEELAAELDSLLSALGAARREAAGRLAESLAGDLKGLGFDKSVQMRFEFTPQEVHPGLFEDRARMLWVPNPGQPPQPLDKIASGGELSRFLLALVGLMTRESLPTLIFDEVDAGIGGLTLTAVGRRVTDLSSRQQVVLITHWPQLAALADRHFQIRKDVAGEATSVNCARLEESDVFAELSRMAGGGPQGEALARELLSA